MTVKIIAQITTCMPSVSSFSKKERLINSNDDDIKDGEFTEVAVVDNPLYTENERDVAAYMKEHEEDGA